MKKSYQAIDIEIIKFDEENVLTSSNLAPWDDLALMGDDIDFQLEEAQSKFNKWN